MRRFSPIVRTGLLVALGVLILLPNVVFPYFEDTALLAAIGNYILQGDRLYVDVFDHKPPAIYLQEAFRIALLGSSSLAARLVEIGFIIPAALLFSGSVGMMARSAGVRLRGVFSFAFILYCALQSGLLWGLAERGQVEFYQVSLVTSGAALYVLNRDGGRGRWAIALLQGLLIGWATWLKPQAGVLLLAGLLSYGSYVGTRREQLRLAMGFVAGVLITIGINVGYLVAVGSIPEFASLLLDHLPAYVASSTNSMEAIFMRFASIVLLSPLWLLLTVFGLAGLELYRRSCGTPGGVVLIVVLGAWGLLSFLSSGYGFYYHAVAFLPAYSYAVSLALVLLVDRRLAGVSAPLMVVSALILALVVVDDLSNRESLRALYRVLAGKTSLEEVYARTGREMHYYNYEDQRQAAEFVRSQPGENFYILGLGAVTYLDSEKTAAARHLVTTFGYMDAYSADGRVLNEIVADLAQSKPALILVRTNDRFEWLGVDQTSSERLRHDDPLSRFVGEHYRAGERVNESFTALRCVDC